MKDVGQKWIELLTILIKYKFADKGTAESTTDEIFNLFLKDDNISSIKKGCDKEICNVPDILVCGEDTDLKGNIIYCDECEKSTESVNSPQSTGNDVPMSSKAFISGQSEKITSSPRGAIYKPETLGDTKILKDSDKKMEEAFYYTDVKDKLNEKENKA